MEPTTQVLLYSFLVATALGAICNKTNFCTMGAVSDWVNMGDTGRMCAWLLAIAVAMIGVGVLQAVGILTLEATRPPYHQANFQWSRYVLGGLLFGVGMTLASGCASRTAVRIGGGNIKSILVLVVGASMAYLMNRTDFYRYAFESWMRPLSVDLSEFGMTGQDLGSVLAFLVGADDTVVLSVAASSLLGLSILVAVFRSAPFRGSFDNVLAGLSVGLAVIAGWYITGGPLGLAAMEAAAFMDQPPPGVAVQSYTFVNPMAENLAVVLSGFDFSLFTFSAVALPGVILGSLLYAVASWRFRIEWFASFADFRNHLVGGALLGLGGSLAMGCTIGQGITGFSTLALGSIVTFVAIVLGSALTMKVQYSRLS